MILHYKKDRETMENEYTELNLSNYTHEDVAQLNAWAIEACGVINKQQRLLAAVIVPEFSEIRFENVDGENWFDLRGDLANQVNDLANARTQHEIQMTDDKHYRDWYRKQQKAKEIKEHGIDE